MDGHPVLLRRAAAAWEHMAGPAIISSTPPPALPKALTQQSGFHAVLSEPPSSSAISHWLLSLRLSSSWACLQEIPDLPKLAAEGDAWEERLPAVSLFMSVAGPVWQWPSPAPCAASGVPQFRPGTPRSGSVSSKESVCACVCVQVEPGLTAGHFPADVGLDASLGHLLPAL